MKEYLVLVSFNGNNNGQPFVFVEGEKVQVDDYNGGEYARAGFLRAVAPNPPKKKVVRKPRRKAK